jgi:pimeloyl-ACP methyl ester carboxylesterase
MFCWVTLLALAQGCSLLKADYQMWENDKTVYFTGIVETDHEAHGPLVVVLYRKGVQPVPVYINVIPRQRGVYHLGVPGHLATGSYGIVAFEDVDEDTQYSTGDPFSVYSGKALSVSAINDPPSESEGLGHIVIAGTSVNAVPPPVFGEAYDALLKRREQSFGGQVSIGQSRFDAAQVREGMFQPLKFVSEGQVGLFMLQPFDPGKVPVVFVHGIGGSPRDWIDVIANLDKEHFQPWVAYYPSGASIGYSALMLSSAMNELRYRHPYTDSVIVAHSMGGLVAMSSLNIAMREGRVPPVHLLVTISTPWLGNRAARWAQAAPTRALDSWLDIAPDSDFLDSIFAYPRPPGLCHSLFYGSGGSSIFVKGENDGVVALSSVLPSSATSRADQVVGFDEGHESILRSDAMHDELNRRLATYLRNPACKTLQ